MIYIIIFGASVLVALIYAGNTFVWLIETHRVDFFGRYNAAPMVIERAYRMETIRTMVEYMDVETFERNRFHMNPMDFGDKIVTSMEHKQHLIEMQAHKLTHEMLTNGFIEMVDIDYGSPDYHPYLKRTMLKVRVYKPEL